MSHYQVLKADSAEQRLGYQWVIVQMHNPCVVAAFVEKGLAEEFLHWLTDELEAEAHMEASR